jgi:hypothetical protein
MSKADAPEVPEGAALFPVIPPELGIQPLLLAVLHATVFLAGSEDDVVNSAAAGETINYMAGYLQRLSGQDLDRVRADLACLVDYARQEKWPKREVQFLRSFLADCGVGEGEADGGIPGSV